MLIHIVIVLVLFLKPFLEASVPQKSLWHSGFCWPLFHNVPWATDAEAMTLDVSVGAGVPMICWLLECDRLWFHNVVLISISLIIVILSMIFIDLLPICMHSFKKGVLRSNTHFLTWIIWFLYLLMYFRYFPYHMESWQIFFPSLSLHCNDHCCAPYISLGCHNIYFAFLLPWWFFFSFLSLVSNILDQPNESKAPAPCFPLIVSLPDIVSESLSSFHLIFV